MTETEKKVKECVKPIIENIGYELYDIIYEKEGTQNYLRIFIDKKGGIDINDCETVNNAITDILDEKDFIKNAYMLEVSSPGIERRIRSDEHLKQNIGNKIQINTYKKYEEFDNKSAVGNLKEFDDTYITIETDDANIIKIKKEDVSKMNTIFNWEEQ